MNNPMETTVNVEQNPTTIVQNQLNNQATGEFDNDRVMSDLENSRELQTNPQISSNDIENNDHRDLHRHRHHRHRHHHRRHRHNRRSHELRYGKTLLHFSAAHILVGIVCVLLQMVQFTNHSILSEAQPGLWCGTFFVITGSVCLGLAKTKGFYSTIAMLCFCLVSLFMALTLASLSWFGAEAASCCQTFWNYNCGNSSFPHITTTATPHTSRSSSETSSIAFTEPTTTEYFSTTQSLATNKTEDNTCYGPFEDGPSCKDINQGFCGYDIYLGRTLHLLLLLAGVIGATTSFVLATLACSRPTREEGGRPRLSSIFAISGSDHVPGGGRPITAWEFPPPTKDVQLATSTGAESEYPNEPPPPYVEQENDELSCHL